MMEEDGISPEERLLRLIKKGKKEPTFGLEEKVKLPDAKANLPGVEKDDKKPLSPKEEKSATPKLKIKRGLKLPHINLTYLITGIAALFLLSLAVTSLFSNKESEDLKRLESLVNSVSKKGEGEVAKSEEKRPTGSPVKEGQNSDAASSFEKYQKLLDEKNVFVSPAASKEKNIKSAVSTLQELSRNLRLVGIMPGDEPQAIIEEKTTAQTFFLKKGEKINDMEITDISSGIITLTLGDETVTLSL